MPAIITHDMFARDLLEDLNTSIADTYEEDCAFLIGNQGPDVFFFSVANPLLSSVWKFGSLIHRESPDPLFGAFVQAVGEMPEQHRDIASAYTKGLLCHYLLDVAVHPLIYSQQYEICDAGIDGLDRRDGHEVHAEIESELDVVVLSNKLGLSINEFNPSVEILRGDETTLYVISCLWKRVAEIAYGRNIPDNAFLESVHACRKAMSAIYSPNGTKRSILGKLERLFRRHSFLQAMSHTSEPLTDSPFANSDRRPWTNPATGEACTQSFWDLYESARSRARLLVPGIAKATQAAISRHTDGLNFNGYPTRVTITHVETIG